jgi:hypothetical protein
MGEDAKLLWQRRLGLKHSFDRPVVNNSSSIYLPKDAFLLVILRQRSWKWDAAFLLIFNIAS